MKQTAIGNESKNGQYINLAAHEAYGKKKIAIDALSYKVGDVVKGVYVGFGQTDAAVCVTDIKAEIYAFDKNVTVDCKGKELIQKLNSAVPVVCS